MRSILVSERSKIIAPKEQESMIKTISSGFLFFFFLHIHLILVPRGVD